MSDNYVVIFEYFEYSEDDEYLGINQDHSEDFETLAQAETFAHDISKQDNVKKAWISPV